MNIGNQFYLAIKEHYPMSSSATSLDAMLRENLQEGGFAVPDAVLQKALKAHLRARRAVELDHLRHEQLLDVFVVLPLRS